MYSQEIKNKVAKSRDWKLSNIECARRIGISLDEYLKSTSFLDVFGNQAVNFGGVQGNAGLSGQVVFVQRGADLVGVLNRTNTNINRIG